MPDNKRIRGPEESQCPLLYLREEEKPSAKPLLKPDGLRQDGRKTTEIRPVFVNSGVHPHATGSAYLEQGDTKVMCTIFGPKESSRREDFTPQGRITCEFKFAPFSCRQRRPYPQDQVEKEYSTTIVHALQRVVLLETFPKLQLEINVIVIENGGSALAASITCASLALATCGVEMLDLPTACTVVHHEAGFLVDPALNEEYMGDSLFRHPDTKASIVVTYLPSLDEVTALKQAGVLEHQDVLKGIDVCIEGCLRVHERLRKFLTEQFTSFEQAKE